jgi:hypothetical protein
MIVYIDKATGRYWPTQHSAPKRTELEKVDVPTGDGREALCDWLNATPPKSEAPASPSLGPSLTIVDEREDAPAPAGELPEHFPAYTQSLVDAMFNPRPPHLREICCKVAKLDSGDLAHVAFEVAAQMGRRGVDLKNCG